jgi:hypothetical protein
MPLVTSRTELSQGTSDLTVTDAAWGSSSGNSTIISSAGLNLTVYNLDDIFEVRGSPIAGNNGLYICTDNPSTTGALGCDKIFGANPVNDTAEAVEFLGTGGGTPDKSVFIDVQGKGIAIIEQGNVDAAGVVGQAIYSFIMQEFKDDDFLIANAPFPMLAIDSDAGKYIIGQDISGNNNGFNWADESTVTANAPIRTRKMLRNAGWDEVDANGITTARYVGVVTLGTFEDTLDRAYYQFGNDTTVDDTVDFTFTDAVNESVQFFERLADGAVGTSMAISADGRQLTRSDGGNWRTDGFLVGGQIQIRDAENATSNSTFLLKAVDDSVNGAITCGRAADAASGLVITATTTITRADGGSWVDEGFYVGGVIVLDNSEDVGNDGTHTIATVTDTVITTTGLTNNADDTTMTVGPFDPAGTPDTVMNASVNNDNELTLKLRIRDGDPKGKTFSQANLASAGKEVLGNFVYAFPLANASDQKIDATDSTITTSAPYVAAETSNHTGGSVTAGSALFTEITDTPFAGAAGDVGELITIQAGNNIGMYEIVTFGTTSTATVDRAFTTTESSIVWQFRSKGMTVTYHATPQVRTDLVGGAANFGIIVDGNNGTSQEVFEFIQYKLRTLGDIDNDADTAVGRTMDGLARFVGDTGEFGTPDGLTFPRNPDGGGSGVYVDNLNSASKNDVIFYDNTNTGLQFPETIQVTLDFNQIALDDSAVEYDLFYDRTVRTSPTGVTLTTGTDVLAGTGLPNTTSVGVGSYVRVAGLADATMDGVYQIVTETTPGASWVVARYDGVAITTVGSSTPTMDIFCVDTPDAKHVHTNVRAAGTASLAPTGTAVIDFTAPDLIDDTQSLFGSFATGMLIEVEGSTDNNGIYTIDTAAAGQIQTIEQTITTEATATSHSVTEIVSGVDPSVDYSFSYDFSNNSQGDRTGTPSVFVKAKAIGATGAQYVQSTVASIVTGTPLTIPLAPATERNYA